jgi:hypothetical protein
MRLGVNLSYTANHSLHGDYSPLCDGSRALLFYPPILDGTQHHHDTASTPPLRRSDRTRRQGWGMIAISYLSMPPMTFN